MDDKPTIAAFDFDKTITTCDTMLPFLLFAAGRWKALFLLSLELPYILGYLAGLIPRQQAKERVITRFFKGMTQKKMEALAERFAEEEVGKYVKEIALEKLDQHQKLGHQVVVVSASLEVYLKPWAKKCGIDCVIASRLEIEEGALTGRLIGKNCWGEEKVRRLVKEVGRRESYTLYAYGDSRGDKDLLESADYPYYRKI